jgi:hypothetical protein
MNEIYGLKNLKFNNRTMSGKVSKLILNTNKVMNEKDKAHDNMPFN